MMTVKYYNCPVCKKKFNSLNGWGNHMDTLHPKERPKGYSTSRFFYFIKTGRTHGLCRTCKGKTTWNEHSMKYNQYCDNPKCKEIYSKMAKERMLKVHGKIHLLNDPEQQKKMLSHRHISGIYKYNDGTEFGFVGSYEFNFIKMLDTIDWPSCDIISPSPHVYFYKYENKIDPNNEGEKFYIPDFYIPTLNLEIEIKQQTSTNQKFNEINRVKEKLKDEIMNKNKDVNYIKINDNDFSTFYKFLFDKSNAI